MKYKNKYSLPSKHMDNSNARTPNKLQYKMVEGVQDSFDFENRGIAAIKKELIPQSSGPLRSIFINPFSPHFLPQLFATSQYWTSFPFLSSSESHPIILTA